MRSCGLYISLLFAVLASTIAARAAEGDLTQQAIIQSLQGIAKTGTVVDPAKLAAAARARLGQPAGTVPPPEWAALTGLPQLTVEINFEFDSIAVVPGSYRALGLMADALHHPLLLGNKFLIVGHTDAKGDAKYNLTLSEKRADAIREILSTTFAVPAGNLTSVGVGSEMPIDPSNPMAAINRRVQVFNIGVSQ